MLTINFLKERLQWSIFDQLKRKCLHPYLFSENFGKVDFPFQNRFHKSSSPHWNKNFALHTGLSHESGTVAEIERAKWGGSSILQIQCINSIRERMYCSARSKFWIVLWNVFADEELSGNTGPLGSSWFIRCKRGVGRLSWIQETT